MIFFNPHSFLRMGIVFFAVWMIDVAWFDCYLILIYKKIKQFLRRFNWKFSFKLDVKNKNFMKKLTVKIPVCGFWLKKTIYSKLILWEIRIFLLVKSGEKAFANKIVLGCFLTTSDKLPLNFVYRLKKFWKKQQKFRNLLWILTKDMVWYVQVHMFNRKGFFVC